MTYTTHKTDGFALPLPITQVARTTAQSFAQQQPTPEKAEQVWLNTLAVCVVDDYLQMLAIQANRFASDSWNPVVRLGADVADLEITGIGRLECRPIKASEQICQIPPEVWEERIGYVVVQIDEAFQEATFLGFVESVQQETLRIDELRSPEALIDRLHAQSQPMITSSATPEQLRVNLSQWLHNTVDAGWQTLESLFSTTEPDLAFSFRGANTLLLAPSLEKSENRVIRAKLIDLRVQLVGYPIALVVELHAESNESRTIVLQVHPAGNQRYLPPSLKFNVLDETGLIFLEAEARSTDDYIQLEFSGFLGELFSAEITLGEARFLEDFVI
jgi:hypothetical protein